MNAPGTSDTKGVEELIERLRSNDVNVTWALSGDDLQARYRDYFDTTQRLLLEAAEALSALLPKGVDREDTRSQSQPISDGLRPTTEGEAPSAADDAQMIERAAEKVYAAMVWAALTRERPDPNWTERGNSLAQTEARRAARYVMALGTATVTPAEPGWQPISSAPRDGWVLVPREPTEEMIQAAIKRPNDSGDGLYADVYRAMVRAAPASPAVAELGPGRTHDLTGEES